MTFYGITDREAVLYIAAVSAGREIPCESTVRSWVSRGKVQRTRDGGIDLESLHHWWQHERRTRGDGLRRC